MLNNRNGQAKILSIDEIQRLLNSGFITPRDRTLFTTCLYTACRISEARKMRIDNVFNHGKVHSHIVIPKDISKGQQGTRSIPAHPTLVSYLEDYYEKSKLLNELREKVCSWSHLGMNSDGKIRPIDKFKCPQCYHTAIFKSGVYWGKNKSYQYYLCKSCGCLFHEDRAIENQTVGSTPAAYDTFGVVNSTNYGLLLSVPSNPHLFPGQYGKGHLSLSRAQNIFAEAFMRVDIVGAGSHSCRRTALTMMHARGVPLRVLQEISGHRDLGALQRYLEVSEEEIAEAIHLLR